MDTPKTIEMITKAIGHLNRAACCLADVGFSSERVDTVRRDLEIKRTELGTIGSPDPLTARRAVADFANHLDRFVADLTKMTDDYRKAHYPNLDAATFTAPLKGTRKYVRVIRTDSHGSGRSVHCFVEKATGNIYKPDGWKGPARNFVRGNIYRDDRMTWMTPHGTATAR